MEDNMANSFDNIQNDDLSSQNFKDSSANNFEVPLPPISIKDITPIPSSDDTTLYEQFPSSPSSTTSSDYPKVISEQQSMIQVNILEQLLQEDSNNPVIMYKLIALYRETKQRDKLNSMRQQALKLFPLSEQMWIDWIRDIKAQCQTIRDQYHLIDLYKTALDDFHYLSLALMFIEFLIGLHKEKVEGDKLNGLEVRKLFREIIRIWGLDIDQSSLIYDMYIDFELKNNCPQREMRAIWRERLAIPQTTIDSIWEEYMKWDESHPNEIAKSREIYDLTSANINYVISLSEQFKVLQKEFQNGSGFDEFIAFLRFDILKAIQLNKGYVFLFFEKALEVNFNEVEIWKLYLSYLPLFDDHRLNLDVLRRACRCCPGEAMFVVLLLREMEINAQAFEAIDQKIEEAFTKSQVPFFQCEIWKCCLEFKCRNYKDDRNKKCQLVDIRKLFKTAIEAISDQTDYVDNLYHIWAEFECYKVKDAKMLMDIMNHIVMKDSSIHNWRAYIYYIKSVGEEQMIREVYKRSFDSCIEEREVLERNWIAWEKVFGTPKSINSTVAYTKAVLNEALQENEEQAPSNIIPSITLPMELENKNNRKVFVKNLPSHYNESDLKQFISKHSQFTSIEEIRIIRDDNGKSRLFAFVDMPSHKDALALVNELNNKLIDNEHTITCAISKPPKEGENDSRTLFVNNLSYSTTKEQLKTVFSVYGNVLDVRLIVNQQTNKPRGYGYVEFQSEESIVLALNETEPIVIDNRKVVIQKSQSVSKIRNKLKYVALVSNLPFKLKESRLEKFFIENDSEITQENIIEVKIVKDNEGASKGFGFAEFDTIQSLTKALALSGRLLHNRPITIKESNRNITNAKAKPKYKELEENSIGKQQQYLHNKTKRSDEEEAQEVHKLQAKMNNKDFSKLFN